MNEFFQRNFSFCRTEKKRTTCIIQKKNELLIVCSIELKKTIFFNDRTNFPKDFEKTIFSNKIYKELNFLRKRWRNDRFFLKKNKINFFSMFKKPTKWFVHEWCTKDEANFKTKFFKGEFYLIHLFHNL